MNGGVLIIERCEESKIDNRRACWLTMNAMNDCIMVRTVWASWRWRVEVNARPPVL
jgi:hypothetical protein